MHWADLNERSPAEEHALTELQDLLRASGIGYMWCPASNVICYDGPRGILSERVTCGGDNSLTELQRALHTIKQTRRAA